MGVRFITAKFDLALCLILLVFFPFLSGISIPSQAAGPPESFEAVSSETIYNVTLSVSPACWGIYLNGTNYGGYNATRLRAGNYTALLGLIGRGAPEWWCPDYLLNDFDWDFFRWNFTGGVTVAEAMSRATNVTVAGQGTLTATFKGTQRSMSLGPLIVVIAALSSYPVLLIRKQRRISRSRMSLSESPAAVAQYDITRFQLTEDP